MKSIVILFVLVSLLSNSFSQVSISGSYAITAICKDGIVMGADTRGTFLLKNSDSVLAYYDTIPKIFVVGNCIVNVMGLVGLGDRFMNSYIDEFTATITEDMSPDICLRKLVRFLNDNYPQHKNDILRLKMFAIGYKGDSAMLCNVNQTTGMCTVGSGVGIADTLTNFGKNRKYNNAYCTKLKCKKVAKQIEKEIQTYAVQYNKTDKVGGPIMLVMIRKDKKNIWLNNKAPRKPFNRVSDLFESYTKGITKIYFKSEQAKQFVYNAFQLPK